MAELNQITVTGGIPSGGSGEVPTLAPIRDRLDTLIEGQATINTRAYGAAATRVAYTGTSAQSAAITATEVLLHNRGDGACYVKAGSNPTATVNDIPLEPGEKFHLRITSGDKIAVLQDDTGGNLNIVPVA